jgi:mannose-6-phosphate isomerase-like protein (cupin superfamily)
MKNTIAATVFLATVAFASAAVRGVRLPPSLEASADHGSLIEHDADVSKREPGTHNGGGDTTGYSFFRQASNPALIFRKRALHPGSGIGLHKQEVDEVYYVVSGTGDLTLDGEKHGVSAGTAILTRPGSSHSLKQTGADDLVIIIAYPPETKK